MNTAINQTTTLLNAINKYGIDHQFDIAIEEMAELTKEIIKRKRGFKNDSQICEEIADVLIMMHQFCVVYGPEIETYYENKLARLQNRLNES